ncbi:MAG: phosphoglycerate kinase [Candidatus Protochlamydia sp.]|nr:phosphoglycerate kinase [Candidatus Protochlamydia sp.]
MAEKLSISNLPLNGKRALIRVDFNVPLDNGSILDDTRIKASLPTIQYVLSQGGAVILMSHLGRPKGKPDPQFSLKICAERLSELLNLPVKFSSDCCGPVAKSLAVNLKPGEVLLLENLRFHPGEENPEAEPGFTKALAQLGEAYINDAFGTAHRAHASTADIAQFFQGKAAMGLLMEKEITYLSSIFTNPKRPFYALLGGAKISTKFKVIEALMKQADLLMIGGAMAYTFFKAQEIEIGDSPYEEEFVELAGQLIQKSEEPSGCRLLLPIDLIVADNISEEAEIRIINVTEGIPVGFQGVDIGPKTIKIYQEELKKAATIFWNGPVGIFERPLFAKGTYALANALSQVSAITIVGGGDSAAAIERAGAAGSVSHLSTGGGATLEYIEAGQLPGITALSDKFEN